MARYHYIFQTLLVHHRVFHPDLHHSQVYVLPFLQWTGQQLVRSHRHQLGLLVVFQLFSLLCLPQQHNAILHNIRLGGDTDTHL